MGNGAKDEGAEEMNPLETLSDDVACQRFEVDEDIRELWHGGIRNSECGIWNASTNSRF